MARVIVWERADGGISVGTPVPGKEERMIEQFEKCPDGIGARRIGPMDTKDLPDSAYRNAWRANPDGTLRVDAAEKAKIDAKRAAPTLEERIKALEAMEARRA